MGGCHRNMTITADSLLISQNFFIYIVFLINFFLQWNILLKPYLLLGSEGTLHCKYHWYPKFYKNAPTFVGLKTLGTSNKSRLVASNYNCWNFLTNIPTFSVCRIGARLFIIIGDVHLLIVHCLIPSYTWFQYYLSVYGALGHGEYWTNYLYPLIHISLCPQGYKGIRQWTIDVHVNDDTQNYPFCLDNQRIKIQ